MLVDEVLGRRAILGPRRDVCIVSIHDYVGWGFDKRRYQELDRPEHVVLAGPGMRGRAVKAMHEDDVCRCGRMGKDCRSLEPLDECGG